MRTSSVIIGLGFVGAAIGLSPAVSFDGSRTPELAPVSTPLTPNSAVSRAPMVTTVPAPPPGPALSSAMRPFDAFRSGTQSLREGRIDQGIEALEFAAGQGLPGAIWKLGRIYADGEGVDKNEIRAFEYFRTLTKAHAYESPGTAYAQYVANAFVTLGHFYLDGIANSEVKSDPAVAYGMFRHAATYFGDAGAQYQVGRMHLQGIGTPKDAVQAARWLQLSANQGQRSAQALLGSMLFSGREVPRQAAMGLFWLTVAQDGAKGGSSAEDQWIINTYWSAFGQATRDERELALRYLESWMGRGVASAPRP